MMTDTLEELGAVVGIAALFEPLDRAFLLNMNECLVTLRTVYKIVDMAPAEDIAAEPVLRTAHGLREAVRVDNVEGAVGNAMGIAEIMAKGEGARDGGDVYNVGNMLLAAWRLEHDK